MFEPDDLSYTSNEYLNVTDDKTNLIIDLLKLVTNQEIKNIKQIKNSGLKSINYEVSAFKRKFIIKSRFNDDLEFVNLEKEASLAERLFNNQIPVTMPLKINNTYTLKKNKLSWQIFDYVDGCELKNPEQFYDAGVCHARLFKCLDLNDDTKTDNQKIFRNNILPQLEKIKLKKFKIEQNTIHLLQGWLEYNTDYEAVTHTDLHPKNIIFNNKGVRSILDFEDVKTYPVSSSFGFSAYKLGRELIRKLSLNKSEWTKILENWLDNVNQIDEKLSFTKRQLGIGALFRIFENIHYCIKFTQKNNKNQFIFEMKKQIRSITETKWMYDL